MRKEEKLIQMEVAYEKTIADYSSKLEALSHQHHQEQQECLSLGRELQAKRQ